MTMNHKPSPKEGSVYDEDGPSDELIHWGKKGMKWGVRKDYQQEANTIKPGSAEHKARVKEVRAFEKSYKALRSKRNLSPKDMEKHSKVVDDFMAKNDAANKRVAKMARKTKYKDLANKYGKALGIATLVVAKIGFGIAKASMEHRAAQASMHAFFTGSRGGGAINLPGPGGYPFNG